MRRHRLRLLVGACLALLVTLGACSSGDDATGPTTSAPVPATVPATAAIDSEPVDSAPVTSDPAQVAGATETRPDADDTDSDASPTTTGPPDPDADSSTTTASDGSPTTTAGPTSPIVPVVSPPPPAPAPPPPPSPPPPPPTRLPLSLVPSTGLIEDQTVVATSTGWPAGASVGISQCLADTLRLNDCSIGGGNLTIGTVGADGSFSMSIRVNHFRLGADCRVPNRCAITAALVEEALDDNYTMFAMAPISFDPAGPRMNPQAALAPQANLRDGDDVAVQVAGLFPRDRISFVQCVSGEQFSCNEIDRRVAFAEPDGLAATSLAARRVIRGPNGPVDCAVASCEIRFISAFPTLTFDPIAITFDGTVAAPRAPSLIVDPADGLIDGQPLTITVDDVSKEWALEYCWDTSACLPVERSNQPGQTTVQVNAQRVVLVPGRDGLVTIDCAAQNCFYRVRDAQTGHIVDAAVTFDATDPVAAPELSVSPTTNLTDGQQVSVVVDNVAGATGSVHLCNTIDARIDLCDFIGVDFDGSTAGVAQEATVTRFLISTGRGGFLREVDCAAASTTCVFLLRVNGINAASVPAEFATQPAAPPGLALTQTNDLTDGAAIAAEVRNWRPFLSLQQCPAGQGSDESNCRWLGPVVKPLFGSTIQIPIVLDRFRGPVDCAISPARCEVRLVRGGEVFASVPVHFDPDAPLLGDPTFAVTPATNLVHRQVVSVSADNLRGDYQGILQCVTGADACAQLDFGAQTGLGSFTTDVQVRRLLSLGATSTHDCAIAGPCELRLFGASGHLASAALGFDASAPLPTPAITVSPIENLLDGQSVTITGSGFSADTVYAVQCNGPSANLADPSTGCAGPPIAVAVDDTGSFTLADFTVRRTIDSQTYGTVDCAAIDASCFIGVGASLADGAVSGRLGFLLIDDSETDAAVTAAGLTTYRPTVAPKPAEVEAPPPSVAPSPPIAPAVLDGPSVSVTPNTLPADPTAPATPPAPTEPGDAVLPEPQRIPR